jgi:HAD superfamily hydrolase (TIGR01509 family)
VLKAVLWDVDGTLVSTKDLYLESYRRALEPYLGRRVTDEDMLAIRPHSELHVLRTHSGDAFDACFASFRSHYAELHPTLFGGVYDGVAEVLAELRARGLPNGIVTGKSRSSWDTTLARIELGRFDVVIADDDVSHPKPSPEGILAALDQLKVDPRHAIYVGDSPVDIEAGQAAGTRAAAAMWSKDDEWRERFIRRTRDYPKFEMLEHPSELLRLIGAVSHV